MEPLNPCRADADQSAITHVQTTTTTTTTSGNAAPPVVSTFYTYAIRVNSNCKWSHGWLDKVVAHEYGHVLIGAEYHSKDKRSIMYWIVKDRGQLITNEDRARVHVQPHGSLIIEPQKLIHAGDAPLPEETKLVH
jgi:hypothetical protein